MSIRKRPALQGELDGACGFYAIVNALHCLEADLCHQELFNRTMYEFITDGDPMCFVEGTRRGTIKNTLSRVIDYLDSEYTFTDDKTGQPYTFKFSIPYWNHDKYRDRKTVIDTLGLANEKEGRVVILGYEHQSLNYAHWTVIKNLKLNSLITHDSSKEKRSIPLSEVRIDSVQATNRSRPFNIHSDDIFIVYRDVKK